MGSFCLLWRDLVLTTLSQPDVVQRRTRARINPALPWTHDQDLQGLVLKNPFRYGTKEAKRPRGPIT
jgi:hypothetical protein